MLNNESKENQPGLIYDGMAKPFSRRKFFGIMGAGTALIVTSAACKKDNMVSNNSGVNLGSGDPGILNYAYALEQLESAFYTQVITTPYSGITAQEMSYLTDVRDHEIAHREFFKAVLGASATPGEVLSIAGAYIKTKLNASNLPTS